MKLGSYLAVASVFLALGGLGSTAGKPPSNRVLAARIAALSTRVQALERLDVAKTKADVRALQYKVLQIDDLKAIVAGLCRNERDEGHLFTC